jgi:hypothetical protein
LRSYFNINYQVSASIVNIIPINEQELTALISHEPFLILI